MRGFKILLFRIKEMLIEIDLSLLTFPIYFLSPILFAQTKLYNWMEEQQELLFNLGL